MRPAEAGWLSCPEGEARANRSGRKERFHAHESHEPMKKMTKRITAALLLLCCLAMPPFLTLSTAALGTAEPMGGARSTLLTEITDKNPSSYERITVKLGRAKLAMQGLYIKGTAYLPFYELLDSYAETAVKRSGKTYRFTAEGLSISAADGDYYVVSNGRYFHTEHPNTVMSDGVLYVPFTTAAKALGITAGFHASARVLTLGVGYTPPVHGDRVYAEDAVYWLSRIISAESRGEPSLGQIAVGNVVLNRVRSGEFPNTIWGVIFDKKYGVQFTPVANGTIYNAPTESAVIAAKICLEGYSLSGDILYFYAPIGSMSSWVEQNRTYVFTIQNHRFFA